MDAKSTLMKALGRCHNLQDYRKVNLLNSLISIDFFSKSEHDIFLSHVKSYSSLLIDSLDDGDIDLDEETIRDQDKSHSDKGEAVQNLKDVTQIISRYTEMTQHRSPILLQIIESLHELLIPLDDNITGVTSLKIGIARICEIWWTREEEGAENLITQLIPFLLITSLGPNSLDADVKRVYNIRSALLLLDFDDSSIESIRSLLLRCYTHPSYLKSAEGKKFLSFLFSVNEGTLINIETHLKAFLIFFFNASTNLQIYTL